MSQEQRPTRYEQLLRQLYQTPLFRKENDDNQENLKSLLRHLGLATYVLGEHPKAQDQIGIENDKRIISRPRDKVIFHVTGSNGKGSVCHKLAFSLAYSGKFKSVGLFTSPHISCFRERIYILQSDLSTNDCSEELISEKCMINTLSTIFDICKTENISITFFEVVTAIAFHYFFIEKNVDAIVLEVGLGGRLDATNVISNPTISVITSIAMEHSYILGNSLEAIAKEKAGIIKSNPVIIGPNVPVNIIRTEAKKKKTPFYISNELVASKCDMDFDAQNSCIAVAALELLYQETGFSVSADAIVKGIDHRPPCRFEVFISSCKVTSVLDVSHNPSAIRHFLIKLREHFKYQAFRFIIGFSSDKDIRGCLSAILDKTSVKSIHLVEASNARAATFEKLFDVCPILKESNYTATNRSVANQVKVALSLSQKNDEVLVVCGSFFLMSEAREALGYNEPRDSTFVTAVSGSNFNPEVSEK